MLNSNTFYQATNYQSIVLLESVGYTCGILWIKFQLPLINTMSTTKFSNLVSTSFLFEILLIELKCDGERA